MRILIIGGTRFIGPAVVRRLYDQGHELAVFHRGETEANLPSRVSHLHGDRQRLSEHAGAFLRFVPDVVVDMAAFSEQDAQTVMATFRGLARRIVVLSS